MSATIAVAAAAVVAAAAAVAVVCVSYTAAIAVSACRQFDSVALLLAAVDDLPLPLPFSGMREADRASPIWSSLIQAELVQFSFRFAPHIHGPVSS